MHKTGAKPQAGYVLRIMKALFAAVLKLFYSIPQVPSITYISEYSLTTQIIIL